MVALQSTPPQLGPPVATLLICVLVGGLIGALGSAIVQRLSNPVGKYRLLYAGVLLPVTLIAYGLLTLVGFGPTLVSRLPIPSGVLETVLVDVVEFLGTGLVWLVAYAPTVRGVRTVRDIELSTGDALVRMTRYVIALIVVVTVAIIPLRLTSSSSPVVIGTMFAILVIVLVIGSAWLIPLLRTTRQPTDDTAVRIETLCERADLDVRDVVLLDTDAAETANALVRGPPNYRRLFVTSTFLDRFEDTTASALLAIRSGRLRSHVLTIRQGTAIGGGLFLLAVVTGMGPRWALLGFAIGLVLVGCWASRRGIRMGDDYAAEQLDTATVADALERYAEVHALEPTRRRIPNPLSVNVALGDRIDRLRAQSGENSP